MKGYANRKIKKQKQNRTEQKNMGKVKNRVTTKGSFQQTNDKCKRKTLRVASVLL